MNRISTARVILFGVGGVGSWCAESLVRSGIQHLTIVDADIVNPSNCNRQLMATRSTLGMVKTEAMRQRLLDINPDLDLVTCHQFYNEENASQFHLEQYDYVIDAIDSLSDKALLVLQATEAGKRNHHTRFFSSMGAALRIDPLRVRTAEFWKVKGDALARALRAKFKRKQIFPAMKFQCVYSEEPPRENQGDTDETLDPAFGKVHVNGSLSHVTMVFGAALAGLVIQDLDTFQ